MTKKSRLIACLAIGVVSASALALSIACGSGNQNSTFPGDFALCRVTYGDACGRACVGDGECSGGLYCKSGACNAECSATTPCPTGSNCGNDGRCSSPTTIFGSDADTNIPNDGGLLVDPDSSCADIDVQLDKARPTVVLLVDQSSSMNQAAGDGQSKWDSLRNAILSPDGGAVKSLENDVSFGLALYSWKTNVGVCPTIVNVNSMFGNYNAIASVYRDAAPLDNTPTGESLLKVAGVTDGGVIIAGGFAALDAGGPKAIVLATDGDPDMCSNSSSNGTDPPRQLTIQAASLAYAKGIPTYVVAVGVDLTEDHQRAVANAGAGKPIDAGGDAGAKYYRSNDQAGLTAALREIITSQRSCVFTLRGNVVPGTEDQGRVTLNGAPLTRNDPNGWRLVDDHTLEVLGTSCATVKTQINTQLQVRFPCGALTNVPSIPR